MWIAYSLTILLLILNTYTDTAETGSCERCEQRTCDGDICICEICWTRHSCDQGQHMDKFEENVYNVNVPAGLEFGATLVQFKACPSADDHRVEFRFVNVAKEDEYRYEIDMLTGEISAYPEAYMTVQTNLQVVARLNDIDSDPVTVRMLLSPEAVQDFQDPSVEEAHSRKRRAAIPPVTDDIEFYLTKTGDYENITEVYVGSRIHFQLLIHFPPGVTDMLVELFTPDNDTNVMVLCDVRVVDCGTNLDERATVLATVPVMEGKTVGSMEYDRAILNFGNITNSNTSTSFASSSMITIEWDAVMIPNVETVNGSDYWVSAGAEYKNENEIWVGQTSVKAIMDDKPITTNPTFNMTGPNTLELGTSAVITVNMYIPNPAADLNFDAFAPLNGSGVISICAAKVISVGNNFACLFDVDTILPTAYPYDNHNGNERVRLAIGTAVNKASRDDTMVIADNLIQVEFIVSVNDDIDLNGNSYWIGAALEIGTDQIWAAQYLISIVDRTDTNLQLPSSPTISMYTTDTQVAVGGAAIMEIEIEIPEASMTEYTLDVVMPSNDSAPRFQVCHVGVTYQGENLPCTRENSEATYTARFPGVTSKTDYATFELGRLRNTGYFNSTSHTTANTIKLSMLTIALNHSLNVPGASVYLTAGLKYNTPAEVWVGQNLMLISDSSTVSSNITSVDYPDFQMNYTGISINSDGNVPVNGMVMIDVEITAQPEVLYSPMDVEIIVPYNNGALYSLCKVEVTHVGKNMPCSDIADIQDSIAASSKDLNEIYDKFALTLGVVYNVRKATQTLEDPDDDKIKLRVTMRVLEHVDNTLTSEEWTSAGAAFDPYKLWVGQLKVTIANEVPYTTADAPYAVTVRQDGALNDDLYLGKSVRYSIVIKPELYTQGPIVVTASVTDGGPLSICSMKLVSVGVDLGCGYNWDRNATLNLHTGSMFLHDNAVLDLGIISNVGDANITANETVDDASIVVDVLVHLDKTASASTSYNVNFQLDSGANTDIVAGLDQTIIAQTAVLSTNTDTATLPTYNFQLTPINDENVTTNVRPGEVKQFHLDIYFAENSSNYYDVKFLAPVNYTGAMEVCSVVVVSVGANLPCLHRASYKGLGTTAQRSGSLYTEIGELDLGYVCQFPLHNDTEESKIRLLVVARVPKHVAMTADNGLWFSATVRINADQIYVNQHRLNLTLDVTTFPETGPSGAGSAVVFTDAGTIPNWRPGTINSLQVNVTVPRNAALHAKFDIETPVGTSAVMTIHKVTVNPTSGANLGCLTNFVDLDYVTEPYSERGTSQHNKATLDMGIITNTGVTVIDENEGVGDDNFQLDIEVMMADDRLNIFNSQHNVSVVLVMGTVTHVADRFITVLRDDFEMPNLTLSANVTNDTIVYQNSIFISIDAEIKHADLSSAEGHNVSVTFYHPPYLAYNNITDLNMTEMSNGPSEVLLPDGGGVSFVFDHLYFTDVVTWSFRLKLVSVASNIQSGNVQDAITPYEVYSNMIYRANNAQPEGHFFTTQLDSLTYQVLPSIGVVCTIGVLGMADGRINDCQLSASKTPNSVYGPELGRDDASFQGWQASNRGSMYKKYYQVYFGNITMVQKIHISPATFTTAAVTQYTVYSSDDGFDWTEGETVATLGNEVNTLSAPAEGRYLRIALKSHNGNVDDDVGVKFEFEGCFSSSDVPHSDVCQASKPWDIPDPTDMYYRGYLVGGGSSFFCDSDPNSADAISCFSSADGATWKVLDQSVMNVIGFNSITNYLYALSSDKRTYLLSEDMGDTWVSVSQAKYAAETGLATARHLPWVHSSQFRDGVDPDATYRTSPWGASYRGMYWYTGGVWNQVTDWSTCCA